MLSNKRLFIYDVLEVNKCDLSLLRVVDSILMHFGYLLLTCYCKKRKVERPWMVMDEWMKGNGDRNNMAYTNF